MSGKRVKMNKRLIRKTSTRMYHEFYAMIKKQPLLVRRTIAWEIITKKNA